MEDFNLTILRPFLKGVGPIEKKNHKGGEGGGGWWEASVCAIAALNLTISDEKLSHYNHFLFF